MNTNMHASTEQLIEIKDGLSNVASEHVQNCQQCQHELEVLQCFNEQIFAEADQKPRPELWNRITATLDMQESKVTQVDFSQKNLGDERGASSSAAHTSVDVPVELLIANSQLSNSGSLSKAVYSLAASILVTGFIGLYIFGQQDSSREQSQLLASNIQELMLNSRGMEVALQKVALQSELLTTADQSNADRLYWRLTYLDQMIQENSVDNDTNPERIKALWNNRIDALTELNQIYYQRKQELNESEI